MERSFFFGVWESGSECGRYKCRTFSEVSGGAARVGQSGGEADRNQEPEIDFVYPFVTACIDLRKEKTKMK